MGGGNYYFWLGASADADRAGGPDGPEPLRVSAKGAHPSRDECSHLWGTVWNDYYSSCVECRRCGASKVHHYFEDR